MVKAAKDNKTDKRDGEDLRDSYAVFNPRTGETHEIEMIDGKALARQEEEKKKKKKATK